MISVAATTNTIIQLTTPDQLRGRVASVYTTVFVGASPLGSLFSGLVAAVAGTSIMFAIAGCVSLGAVGAAAVVRSRQPRDDALPTVEAVPTAAPAGEGRPLR